MRLLRFDGLTGVAGDMFVGALLDLGASWEKIRETVISLGLEGVEVSAERVVRGGVTATKFEVTDTASGLPVEQVKGSRLRGPLELIELIEAANLISEAREHAVAVVTSLAKAEAKVHGVAFEEVHFHEVGALDTLVDIVAASVAWCDLGVAHCASSAVRVGSGEVKTEHGLLPVPAPATVELLKGAPVAPGEFEMELTTPTGAALLTHFCDEFGPGAPMKVTAVGYGAGTRDLKRAPNVFRAILGEAYDGA